MISFIKKKWKFFISLILLLLLNYWVWSDIILRDNSNVISSKEVEFNLSLVDVDTIKTENLRKYITTKIDSFYNDTSLTINKKEMIAVKNRRRTIEIRPYYSGKFLSMQFFVNKYYSGEYGDLDFRIGEEIIGIPIIRLYNTGDEYTLLDWEIDAEDDYTLLKKISNSKNVLIRLNNDPDTDVLMSKNQLNSIKIFCRYLESKNLAKNIFHN